MKKVLLCFAVTILTMNLFAGSKKIGENVEVRAYRTSETMIIDGKLEENIWKNSPPIDNFIQRDPTEGNPCSEKTLTWIAYDENAIYVAARLYDSKSDSIIGRLSRRDNFNESDWFFVYLDPYNDKRTGYFLAVNAGGSIIDGTLFNDGWDDMSWNGIWDYAVNKDAEGWYVEMKIPFTQLRFNQSDDMEWGVNFSRQIQRKNERSYFIMVPKKESGFVSHFASLKGLRGIKTAQRFEVLPYFVEKAQFLLHDRTDPYYKSQQFKETFGADIKVGLGSNLNLDVTINPDFGQVEVDPAVVNLSAFETYFDEKRPFFIEGNNIFMFGYGGTNNNWGFNWGNPEIFYSRRIGRSPQGSVDTDLPVLFPSSTNIVGAAKLTGKVWNGISLGLVNATTERTYANVYTQDNVEVEPLTNYSVLRAQKEFNDGKQGLGFIGTSVIRDLKGDMLKEALSEQAFVGGIDGWTMLDKEDTYVLTGYFSGSIVKGSNENMIRLQRKSLHYFQRPDAKSYDVDSNSTSLAGYIGRLALNKQKGNFYVNASLGAVSPGYEANDLGFQWRADHINTHLVLGYRWYEPDGIFRNKSVHLAGFQSYNYDGNPTDAGVMAFWNFRFMNYWGFNGQLGFNPPGYNSRATRGGPLFKHNGGQFMFNSISSDYREKITFSVGHNIGSDNLGGFSNSISFNISWVPQSNINFSIEPFFDYNDEKHMWVDNIEDATNTATYGYRHLFANLEQRTFGSNIRLNWTFTPTLSIQLFVQPLLAVGKYQNFKEMAKPGTAEMLEYGKHNGSTISLVDNVYEIDPDGNGPAQGFGIDNPDFNYKFLKGNLILRWEFNPGSTFYLVWAHDRVNDVDPGNMRFGRDFGNLWKQSGNNVFMAKFSYWLDF